MIVNFYFAGRPLRRPLSEQFRHDQRPRRDCCGWTACRTSSFSASATTASASGSIRRRWRPTALTPATWPTRFAAKISTCRPGRIGQPPAARGQPFDLPIDTLGRLSTPEQFGDIIVKADLGIPRSRLLPRGPRSPPALPSPGHRQSAPAELSCRPARATCSDALAQSGRQQPPRRPTATTSTTTAGRQHDWRRRDRPVAAQLDRRRHDQRRRQHRRAGRQRRGTTQRHASGGTIAEESLRQRYRPAKLSGLSINSATAGSAAGQRLPRRRPRAASRGSPSVGIVRLRDVGRVEMGSQNYRQAMTFDGHPSVGVAVFQLPGTNALDVAERVKAKMKELEAIPRRRRLQHRLRHHAVHPRIGRPTCSNACARPRCWSAWWCSSSCRPGDRC